MVGIKWIHWTLQGTVCTLTPLLHDASLCESDVEDVWKFDVHNGAQILLEDGTAPCLRQVDEAVHINWCWRLLSILENDQIALGSEESKTSSSQPKAKIQWLQRPRVCTKQNENLSWSRRLLPRGSVWILRFGGNANFSVQKVHTTCWSTANTVDFTPNKWLIEIVHFIAEIVCVIHSFVFQARVHLSAHVSCDIWPHHNWPARPWPDTSGFEGTQRSPVPTSLRFSKTSRTLVTLAPDVKSEGSFHQIPR